MASTPATATTASAPPEILPGRLGNLTVEQQATLDAFRTTLVEKQIFHKERHDDHTLLRFLRARKFDPARSLEMLSASEKWRTEMKVDEIYETFRFEEQQMVNTIYPRFYHNVDKLGRPIYVEILGKLELDALFKLTTKERMQKFFIFEYERLMRDRLPACTAAVNETAAKNAAAAGAPAPMLRNIETSCTVLDLKNCSIMQALRIKDQLQMVAQIGQNYYPETMGMTFIINAPWLFDTVWNVVKLWLDEVTVKKIFIFKDGKDHLATLREYIDMENFPVRLGGKCQCADLGGCESSDVGPWNKGK